MDTETRDALIAICESLKAEFRYLASLDRSLFALYAALRSEIPHIDESTEATSFAHHQEHPGSVEQIQLIDALLKKLRKE